MQKWNNSIQQSASWESKSHSASQEIRRHLWKPKVHYRVNKNQLCPRVTFRNTTGFFDKDFSAFWPTSKLNDHPLSAFRNWLFGLFTSTFHIWRSFFPSETWESAMQWWYGS
jgi:hypothetical protein